MQNQSRGCQELPNNSPFNIPVNTLPVDAHSSRWLTRVAEDGVQYPDPYHNIKFYPQLLGLYDNPVTNSTQQQLMHFFYPANSNGYQDTNFPIPPERTLLVESGRSVDAYSGSDRHLFTMNTGTCTGTEIYNLYVDFRTVSFTPGNPTSVTWATNTVWPIPQNYSVYIAGATGAWAAANGNWRLTLTGTNSGTLPFDSSQWGAPPSGTAMTSLPAPYNGANYNSQGGQKFSPASYAQMGGVDAAGMPMSALSLKLEEWYAATQAGRSDLGHALRTTMSNSYLSARNIWPATLYALSVSGFQNKLLSAVNGATTTFTAQSDISQSNPCDGCTYTPGCQFHVTIFGLTGAWAAANGDQTATAIDNYHFTVSLNSSGWGPLPAGYGVYFVDDFFPYGATVRLSASVDLDQLCTSTDLTNWCPYAKVYLATLQKYGMVVADGTTPSDNWDNGTMSSEFHPNVLIDAASNITQWAAIQPIEGYLEVVNRSSQQMSTNLSSYQQTNTNRTYVTVCGSAGCASDDVILQGTTIGTDRERLTMAAGTSYQMNVWVNGNVSTAVSYAIDSGISGSGVSPTGVVTMPNCASKEQGMITVTSSADSQALPLYVEVSCLPVSPDGSYRLALGNYTGDYLDSTGETWYGSWHNNGFNNAYEAPGLWWGSKNGSWQGFGPCDNDTWAGADSQLYSRSTDLNEDTRVDVVLPNGSYNLTLYGEPGFGGFGSNGTCGNSAGQNIYDWVIQGQTAGSWLDGYVLAGMQSYNGYTVNAPATVSDNVLATIGRMRTPSMYGMSWSSLLIMPGNQPLRIVTGALPGGTVNTPYSAYLTAAGGTSPYSWGLASGSGPMPPGLAINAATGLISGTPTTNGAYSFTVQVTDSASNTATRNLNVVISGQGTFSIVASPFAVSAAQGGQARWTVSTTASNGFNSSVALSASGLPAGATVSFTPSTISAPGSGSAAMVIAIASNSPTGSYTITITGTGGGAQQSTMTTLKVNAGAGSFSISGSPSSLNIAQGAQGSSTITTAITTGFNNAIALSATGMPSGVTVAFSPTSIAAPGNGSSAMTITVASSSPTGTYPITVIGNGGGIQQNATVTLTVTGAPSFTLSASPGSLSVAQGAQGGSTVTTAISNGFNNAIALSATGMPSGVSVAFNPTTIVAPGNGSSAVSITVASSTPIGTYPITITGNGGGLQQNLTITLIVTAPPSFTMSASPTSLSIVQGSQGSSTITTAISNGFNSAIALSATGMPSGVTVAFNPTTIVAPGNGSSTMTITVASGTPTGTFPITVTGNGGGIQHSATIVLTVTGTADFTVTVTPSSQSVKPGHQANYTVTLTAVNGFNHSVSLSYSGCPLYGACGFRPSSLTPSGNSTFGISTNSSTPTGTYTLTITGTSGSLRHSTTVTLTVSRN